MSQHGSYISIHKQNFIKIQSLFLKIPRNIEILTSIKRVITLLKSSGKFHVLQYCSVTIMHIQNFIKIHQFVLKIFNGNKILISFKGHNSVEK